MDDAKKLYEEYTKAYPPEGKAVREARQQARIRKLLRIWDKVSHEFWSKLLTK